MGCRCLPSVHSVKRCSSFGLHRWDDITLLKVTEDAWVKLIFQSSRASKLEPLNLYWLSLFLSLVSLILHDTKIAYSSFSYFFEQVSTILTIFLLCLQSSVLSIFLFPSDSLSLPLSPFPSPPTQYSPGLNSHLFVIYSQICNSTSSSHIFQPIIFNSTTNSSTWTFDSCSCWHHNFSSLHPPARQSWGLI